MKRESSWTEREVLRKFGEGPACRKMMTHSSSTQIGFSCPRNSYCIVDATLKKPRVWFGFPSSEQSNFLDFTREGSTIGSIGASFVNKWTSGVWLNKNSRPFLPFHPGGAGRVANSRKCDLVTVHDVGGARAARCRHIAGRRSMISHTFCLSCVDDRSSNSRILSIVGVHAALSSRFSPIAN